MANEEFEAAALFEEADLGFDKVEANTVLDIRARFDNLPLAHQRLLAESIIRLSAGTLGLDNDDLVEEALMEYKGQELDRVEELARLAASACGLCEEQIAEDEPVVVRQMVWVTPGSNQVQIREDVGESAHAHCVKRVKEGGSAEAPIF